MCLVVDTYTHIALPVKNKKGRVSNMMTLDEIRERLKDRRKDVVAEAAKVSRKTLWGITSGRTLNPSYDVVKTLSDYFTENN